MPIEKMTLGLQVILTVAIIWLGYVGYELAKAQNQIAEVQTYGLPPTASKTITQHNDQGITEDGMSRILIKLGFSFHNNQNYPIKIYNLIFNTQKPYKFRGCDEHPYKSADGLEHYTYYCPLTENVAPKEVFTPDLHFFEEQPLGVSASFLVFVEGPLFFYYDPVKDQHLELRYDADDFLLQKNLEQPEPEPRRRRR